MKNPKILNQQDLVDHIFTQLVARGVVVNSDDINMILDIEMNYLIDNEYVTELDEEQATKIQAEQAKLYEDKLPENKFLVFKRKDIDKYLNDEQKYVLCDVSESILEGRAKDEKPFNTYLVINRDEAYAPEVEQILKDYGHWGVK